MRRALAIALLFGLSSSANAASGPKTLARHLDDEHTYRHFSPSQSKTVFHRRFQKSLKHPEDLVRSYAGVFWRLVRKQPPRKSVGGMGRVLGDAHHENIGFVRVGRRTVFGMTDFDDGGEGLVAEDAAHYFTVLRLTYGKKLTRRIIDQYAAAVVNPAAAVAVDGSLAPDWKAARARDMDRAVKGEKFRFDRVPDLSAASGREALAVRQAAATDPRLAGMKVLDVARLERREGGSAGLKRYWILVRPNGGGKRAILELKELGRAGVAELGVAQTQDAGQRVDELKTFLWGMKAPEDWTVLKMGGKSFLVRDRAHIEKVELGQLSEKKLEHVLAAQAGYMAGVHRSGYAGVKAQDIADYLDERSGDLAKAYRIAGKRLAD